MAMDGQAAAATRMVALPISDFRSGNGLFSGTQFGMGDSDYP